MRIEDSRRPHQTVLNAGVGKFAMASGLVDRELRPSLNALGGTFSVHHFRHRLQPALRRRFSPVRDAGVE